MNVMNESSVTTLSIVSPVYNSEEVVDALVARLLEEVPRATDDFEIILVEDGSSDRSWEKIQVVAQSHPRVRGIRLSRNFGQHNAIAAGLEAARGQYVVVMDCDLQDNPKYIPALFEQAREGHEIVFTLQNKRNHGFFKNFFAWLYYVLFRWLCSIQIDMKFMRIGAYSMISRKVVNAYLQFHDYRKSYLTTLLWLGFPYVMVPIVHDERFAGRSSYSFLKLFRFAIHSSISYSDRMLYMVVYSGLFFSLLAFVGIVYIVYRYLTLGSLEGWSSLMVAIMFFSGMMLVALGIIGIYIGYVFEQTKHRPRFVIRQTVNG